VGKIIAPPSANLWRTKEGDSLLGRKKIKVEEVECVDKLKKRVGKMVTDEFESA
jgi:hypothetical protein